MKKEIAMFGAGCFWHIELGFSKIKGVLDTKVGYSGGKEKDYPAPTYEQVCSDRTGHAEAVRIEFNPKEISYSQLLDIFWKIHNPTTLNRQGLDIGKQYRSIIFYFNEKQKKEAEASRDRAQKRLGENKIVTEIVKAGKFYEAEEYHQKYLEKRGKNTC